MNNGLAGAPRAVSIEWVLLCSTFLLPPAGLMILHASSMTLGLAAASVLILATEAAAVGRLRTGLSWRAGHLRAAFLVVAAILTHAVLLSIAWHQVEWTRLTGSLFAVMLVLLAAACMRDRFLRLPSRDVTRILSRLAWLLVAMALYSLVGPPLIPPLSHPFPIVVFSEPSHFALAFLPLVGFFIVQLRGWRRWAVVIGATALALALRSTTLLAGLVMLLVTCMRWRQVLMLGGLALVGAIAMDFDASYIVNRLVFSEEIHNLSNLVLLQGWERAWLALQHTHGLGLGFQQFGVWGPTGDIQDLIYAVSGANLNLADGGTTASKLVAEFGLLGIALLAGWFAWWWKASVFLRQALNGPAQPAIVVFMHVAVVCIGVELWVRGIGYLSPGLFLLGLIVAGRPVRVLPPVVQSGARPRTAPRRQRSMPSLRTPLQ